MQNEVELRLEAHEFDNLAESLNSRFDAGLEVTKQDLPEDLKNVLSDSGLENLLSQLNNLEAITYGQQNQLLKRLEAVNWRELSCHYQAPSLDSVQAPEVITLANRSELQAEAVSLGKQAYSAGEVALLLVAGGDGSRLGFDQPKGCFPIGPVTETSLYQKFADKIHLQSERSGVQMPMIIMTGPNTDLPTRNFFIENKFFGLNPAQVFFFCQSSVPTTTIPDSNGRFELLFKGPGELLESPNGHGGTIDGLISSGALDWMLGKGIKDIAYLQVDNALAKVYDPFSVGLRRLKNLDLVTKVIPKVSPEEKMGALVSISGAPAIVEYSDLSTEQQNLRNPDNTYLFGWGNVAAHIFATDFFVQMRETNTTLPYHQAQKKVHAWTGKFDQNQLPLMQEVQGRKSERFIFDVLAQGNNAGIEISRMQEFAPLKNKNGADSIDSARELLSKEYSRWLQESGLKLEESIQIEISNRVADSSDALREIGLDNLQVGRDYFIKFK